jgi:hypothetical protein
VCKVWGLDKGAEIRNLDTVAAKVEAPKINGQKRRREILQRLIATCAVLEPCGVMVCVTKWLARTGDALVASSL